MLRLTEFGRDYSLLEALPDSLMTAVITHPLGTLEVRTLAVLEMRRCFLEGHLPTAALSWPAPEAQHELFSALKQLGVMRFCRNNEDVTDALILNLVNFLESRHPMFLARKVALLEALKSEELASLQQMSKQLGGKNGKKPHRVTSLNAEQLAAIALKSESSAWVEVCTDITQALAMEWQGRIDLWLQLEEMLGDLQLAMGLGFDYSRGLLQSHGWMNMVALRKLLQKLPPLQRVIQALGRMRATDGEPVIETILEPVSRTYQRQQDVRTPLAPMETRGITRTDNISRMLPQEAALLGHPVLKKLWHAKRAEHALVSYAVEGVIQESLEEVLEEQQEVKRSGRQRNEERGPIIVCLDTSGSMRGKPEDIAKALVLETLCVASKERRGCYVYLFGSRNEITELELTADEQGIERLIRFLCMSFGGGTDVEGPLHMALDKCKKTQWRNADILVVSDGEFSYPDSLIDRIKKRRSSHALAVHGVLIGNASPAMKRLCDPLHHFSKWTDLTSEW